MRNPLVASACLKPGEDKVLNRIMSRCGAYYHSGALFYQELWKERLIHLGFRVLLVEQLQHHRVWDIRLCGNVSAQAFLLVSKKVPAKLFWGGDALAKQLESEIRQIARDLGPPISKDCITVVRTGKYFRASFIWPMGKPGWLLKREKAATAFSFLIRTWLKKNRN